MGQLRLVEPQPPSPAELVTDFNDSLGAFVAAYADLMEWAGSPELLAELSAAILQTIRDPIVDAASADMLKAIAGAVAAEALEIGLDAEPPDDDPEQADDETAA